MISLTIKTSIVRFSTVGGLYRILFRFKGRAKFLDTKDYASYNKKRQKSSFKKCTLWNLGPKGFFSFATSGVVSKQNSPATSSKKVTFGSTSAVLEVGTLTGLVCKSFKEIKQFV